jgi:AraC-like DNA-binding protein
MRELTRVCGRRTFPPVDALRASLDAGQPWQTTAIAARVRAEYRPRIRGALSFFFTERGFAEVTLRGRTLPLAAQNFALSPAGERFTLVYPEDRVTDAINVYFADELVADALDGRTLDQLDRRPVLRTADARLAAAADAVKVRIGAGALALEQAVVDLLCIVLSRPSDVTAVARLGPAARVETRRRVLRSIDYLVAYADRDLTLDELARAAGLSKFHFLRMFRASTGSTPSRYLSGVRVERAKGLLRRTELSVTDIALEVGFAEQSSFTRAFARREGVSPTGFRTRRE